MRELVGSIRRRRDAPRERGATLVLFALLSVVLFIIVALVVDLGFVRQNRQIDKSSADFAAAAGIRAMDDGSGAIYPWHGICAARDYLIVNNSDLATATNVIHRTGAGVTHATNPCSFTSSPPYTTPCDSTTVNKATWGVYEFDAGGDAFHVTISSGYRFEDEDVPFAEDSGAYAGDPAAAASNGCDQLAVVVEQKEDAIFGGIVGASEYGTRIRSVSRLIEGTDGDVAAALILLEREDCAVLDVRGDTASVRVRGNLTSPGVIHADTDGNGDDCGKIFEVNGSTPPPRIITEIAEDFDPLTGAKAEGQMSTYAQYELESIFPNTSDGYDHACPQAAAGDCGASLPVTHGEYSGRQLVTRKRIDDRYLDATDGLRDDAATYFASSTVPDATWHPAGCPNGTVSYSQPRVWFDCDGGSLVAGGKTFESTVREIVVDGTLTFTGPGTFHVKGSNIATPTKVYVKGTSGIAIQLNGGRNIYVNDGGLADLDPDDPLNPDNGHGFVCDERYASSPTERAVFVLGSGGIRHNGGEQRLCQTTMFLMDGSSGADCPLPDPDAYVVLRPDGNGCQGRIIQAGGSKVDWTAPNAKNNAVDLPDQTDWDNFEDLAFWSESSDGWGLTGGGDIYLAGIYFTPNADPFSVGGTGYWNILDAQFITRKLEIFGGGELEMKPDPFNAVPIPALKGFRLVR